jgi:hypothetical protein
LAVKVGVQGPSDFALQMIIAQPAQHKIPNDATGRRVHHGHWQYVVVNDLLGALQITL